MAEVARIVISLDDAKGINVNYPQGNSLVSYGMLELAKVAIAENEKAKASAIIQAVPALPSDLFKKGS